MIILQKLKWSNLFSYGENNEIDFSKNPLTQLVGLNGHGKSSIALILEEVLYNKNSKGIKKADILNRFSKSKTYSIELVFEKDGDVYQINTSRSTNQVVKLTKNGEDISSHTATATYKTIEQLIGYDHKTFCQIVYQSSANSLEFLTATDSARKKFLIDLLNLSKYVEIGEIFKDVAKSLDSEISTIAGKISGIQEWITKYSSADLSKKILVEVPSQPSDLEEQNSLLRDRLLNIDSNNKRIIQNNKYKELLDGIELVIPDKKPVLDFSKFNTEKIELSKTIKDCDAFIQKMNKLHGECPTCLQDINPELKSNMLTEYSDQKQQSAVRLKEVETLLTNYEAELREWNRLNDQKEKYEQYHSLYDPNMATELLDAKELQDTISANDREIKSIKLSIEKALDTNNKILAHNARVDVILSQQEEMKYNLSKHETELLQLQDNHSSVQVLVKTFSATGLVAYKIEYLVKDLEKTTNEYLTELSDGRFQLGFRISGNDKLNVVITDHGRDIEILALSGGERARVNVAALLGIRKLMQSLSNIRINLLILDETIENLDLEGKEKLVEILLKEEYLNTFVVSHGFQHALLEKITVIKQNNISRIENG
jgi:DNA repair exonuclease SbcCD ATPase subunit